MLKRLTHWRDRFYAGPRFLGVSPPRRNGYQSPTVTAVYWAYALVVSHFTAAGRIVFLCAGLIMLYAMFSLRMPIHLLGFGVVTLFAVNLLVGLFAAPRLDLSRDLPERIEAGSEHPVHYVVRNTSRHPLWDLWLDTLPFPRGVRLQDGHAFIESLAPGAQVRASAVIRGRRRGRYTLPVMRADSAFPFNLWRWGVNSAGGQRIIVYPKFTPLANLDLDTGVRYQSGGIALSSHVGESMEFLGCREFRDGDDPRRLHWRSWARTTYPVVKEFREEYLCRTALIIDTCRPPPAWFHLHWAHPPDVTFEAAVSLAAAIADFLAEKDYIVDLFAAGPEVYRFQGGRSLAYLEDILDILACLQPHRGEPFSEFSDALLDELVRISSAVFVLLTWNDTRRHLLEQAAVAGVTVRAVLIAEDDHSPSDLPTSIKVLHAQDIREGRCTSI